MRLLYGTTNPAKMDAMGRWLRGLPVELMGLSDLPSMPEDVEETGDSPLENARIKAIHYRNSTGMTVLAADSGLYLDGLVDALQPGVHARRVSGGRMGDGEMLAYYAELVASLGGRALARYRNGLCIAFADGRLAERFDDSVASEPFYLVDTPHARRTPGFPLDSLSVDIASGQYYHDLPSRAADGDLAQENGYLAFVREALEITI